MKPQDRLDAIEEARIYKRNLPHIEEPGSVYFITFRTDADCVLPDAAKDIALSTIKFHAEERYWLYACIVMATHVHIILRPMKEPSGKFYSIAGIMHSIKSYASHQINKNRNAVGNIWLDENYDRIIRDDKEFLEKINYIKNNPVEAGIVKQTEEYRWLFLNDSTVE